MLAYFSLFDVYSFNELLDLFSFQFYFGKVTKQD